PEKHTLRILMYEIKLTDVILQGSSFCNSGFHHQMQTCSIQSVNPHYFNVTQQRIGLSLKNADNSLFGADGILVSSRYHLVVTILVSIRHHLGFYSSPSWFLVVTILVSGRHHVGFCSSPSWFLVVTILVSGRHHLGFCSSPSWFLVVTILVSGFNTAFAIFVYEPLSLKRKFPDNIAFDIILSDIHTVSAPLCFLQLCGNILNTVYCGNYFIVKLACSDTRVNNIYGLFYTVISIIIPLLLILYTYMRILRVCFSGSKQTRQKAL
ncbi:hypothetical protein JOQ06_012482, partial [Pogonophryne albipinna]